MKPVFLHDSFQWLLFGAFLCTRRLNFKNIKKRNFAVIDWNYTAYC
jgi:hypothetical protein